MGALTLSRVLSRNIILNYIAPLALLALIISAIVSQIGQPFFRTPFLPGGRGSIEYVYIASVAEKIGYGRPYTFYALLTYSMAPFVGDLLIAAKTAAMLLFVTYLVGLYFLASLYSSRWLGLFVLPTAFLPMVTDTFFKGDYMSLTTMALATVLLIGLTLLLREMNVRIGVVLAVLGSSALPFGDPTLLPSVTVVLVVALVVYYVLKRQLLIYSVLVGSVFAGMALLSRTLNSSFADGLWRPNPLEQFASNIIIAFVLVVSAAVGGFNLYRKGYRKELVLALVWVLASLSLSMFHGRSLVLLAPLILVFIPSSLIYWRETVKVRKVVKEKEPYYEVEVDLGLALRGATAAIMVVLLVLAMPSAIILGDHESQPPVRIGDVEDASQFLRTVSAGQLIVAHPSIANWLSATSHLMVLPTVNSASFEIADLLTTTSFRIITPYLKVDDWQPFSAAKAPLIYVYDGKTYRPLLYIDDSYSRVILKGPKGEEFTESPYRARYLGHKWTESERDISLEIRFQSAGLFINKTVTVSKTDPVVKIVYSAKVFKKDVRVVSFMLNVYSVPMATLPRLDLEGNRVYMNIDGHRFTIDYSGNLVKLSQNKTKDQRYSSGIFQPSSEVSIGGSVTISSSVAISSGHEPWYAAFNDLVKKLGVKYVVVPKEHQVFLEEALPTQVTSLQIKDSFVRYIINSEGKNYQEAPAYALVLNETTKPNSMEIWYKTAGLYIRKTVKISDQSIDVTYQVSPHKPRTYLILSTLSVWIDWGRTVVSYSMERSNSMLKLVLDSAVFTLQLKGNVSNVSVEPHPEYGQMRVLVTYSLSPNNDSIGLSIESDKRLIARYIPTTRPEMSDSDSLIILTEAGVFKPVKDLKLYTIFEITPP